MSEPKDKDSSDSPASASTSSPQERKRGKLSKTEMAFIRANCVEMSIQEIAENLNRTEEPIKKFILNEGLESNSTSDSEVILGDLRATLFYKSIQAQFYDDEILRFEQEWLGYYAQFNKDVTHTEANHILDAIRIEILIDRCLKEQKETRESLLAAEKYLQELQDELLTLDDKEERQQLRSMIKDHTQHVFTLQSGNSNYISEYKELLTKKEKFAQQLKVTREQRKKHTEDAKTNFPDWIRSLANEDIREALGFEMEVQKVAADKAEALLAEVHEYGDGNVDQPLLNSNTVIDEENDE